MSVGIVIVSHSPDVAKGAADMVRQMVGDDVVLAFTGGTEDGRLGTDALAIKAAIEQVLGPDGVAILVDLGGAELNSEMAIEMFEESDQAGMRICNAPVVEGAVLAGVEASSGASLAEVVAAAEGMNG